MKNRLFVPNQPMNSRGSSDVLDGMALSIGSKGHISSLDAPTFPLSLSPVSSQDNTSPILPRGRKKTDRSSPAPSVKLEKSQPLPYISSAPLGRLTILTIPLVLHTHFLSECNGSFFTSPDHFRTSSCFPGSQVHSSKSLESAPK